MAKEFQVKHSELQDPNTITQRNIEEFKRQGLDIHVNEVEELIDDYNKGVRIYKVKETTKYFFTGG